MNRPLTVQLDHHPMLAITVTPDTAMSWQAITANTLTSLEDVAATLQGNWDITLHTGPITINVTPQ